MFWLVNVFVSQLIGPVHGHLTVSSLQHLNNGQHTNAKPDTMINEGNPCVSVFSCVVVCKIVKINC